MRQPLERLTVVVPEAEELSGTYQEIIADELNLKSVELLEAAQTNEADFGIGLQLVVNARAAGPRLGKDVQHAIKGAKSGDWSVQEGSVTAYGLQLHEGEYELTTTVSEEAGDKAVTTLPAGFLVLDTELTPQLVAEGTARDVIRTVQAARKAADLNVSDRIRTTLTALPEVIAAVDEHAQLVTEETLTADLDLVEDPRPPNLKQTSSSWRASDARAAADPGRAVRPVLGRIGLRRASVPNPENDMQPRLEPMRMIMDLLGNPERSAPAIHITGTNGKTSAARMIEAGLLAHDLRTGRYSSPHMGSVTERISVDGVPVSDETFVRIWDEIRPHIGMVDERLSADGEVPLTLFECLTVLAFAVFADEPVDVMVLEVGLGGAWDATNVVSGSVQVVTPISLDHTDLLGDSEHDIALEKVGIIKPGGFLVSAAQVPEAADVLLEAAREAGVPFRFEGWSSAWSPGSPASAASRSPSRGSQGATPICSWPCTALIRPRTSALRWRLWRPSSAEPSRS